VTSSRRSRGCFQSLPRFDPLRCGLIASRTFR
jgi:hypothetical protein